MAIANLLSLLDDIVGVLDDVAVLSKLAAKKTAGVLGDDLALNAHQMIGIQASRELPVVWAVAKGSLWNKAILVPGALFISIFIPWLVTPLLMVGGTYLCFEGFEKLAHRFFLTSANEDLAHKKELANAVIEPAIDMVALEQKKIRGAIRTDFILSAEIIIIALGSAAEEPFVTRLGVLVAVALLMTLVVYGFVAIIIKLDDLGIWLQQKNDVMARNMGIFIVSLAPWLMRFLSIAGTAAMFIVGGGILIHSIAMVADLIETLESTLGGVTGALVSIIVTALLGVIAGGGVFLGIKGFNKIFSK
jgi:predicted DNA repair protein MutK